MAEVLATEHELEVVGLAADGRELRELVGRLRPDLVVADTAMPGGGPALVAELTAQVPRPAILSISGAADPGMARALLAAGADAFVRKGLDNLLANARRLTDRVGEG